MIATLAQFIATEILKNPRRVIEPGEPLITSGLVDSFSRVALSNYVEDTYGVHIEDYELTGQDFDTLNELAALIAGRQ